MMVDESEARYYDERGAIGRMLAGERALAPEPYAIVLSTPSGVWFYVRCREHGRVPFGIGRRHYADDKPEAVALAEAHNAEHAEGT